jgi:hypothetical protein
MDNNKKFTKTGLACQTDVAPVVEIRLPVIPEGPPAGSAKGRMMVKRNSRQDYAEYLDGDSWKCSKSPSKAHHWIFGTQAVCKYCLVAKLPQADQLPTSIGAYTITK